MSLQLRSSAFEDGGAIPVRHTCQGQDISPSITWANLPPEARSLALICDDPDAPVGTWVHWVLYDISPSLTGLPEGVPATDTTPLGARQGLNDFRRLGYGGPCPPPGGPHRYFFKLYALDAEISLRAGATKDGLLKAMEGHVLAEGQLMGTYRRR